MKKLLSISIFIIYSLIANSQNINDDDFFSAPEGNSILYTKDCHNGWYLAPYGTLRILLIFAEINYDVHPQWDIVNGGGNNYWQVGGLPIWKDSLFEPNSTSNPQALLTKYYYESSFDTCNVLGDYINQVFTVNESDITGSIDYDKIKNNVIGQINIVGSLNTAHGFSPSDFDMWQNNENEGDIKINSPDSPNSYDHVMLILRNYHGWKNNSGIVRSYSVGNLLGHNSDTHSIFNGGAEIPFNITHHEFSHLFLGDNSFHIDGGATGGNYFIPLNRTWGSMAAAFSTLLTCNAWEKDRLNWTGPGKTMTISARDASNITEVNGDLDASNPSDAGIYLLRDFVTTGDAIRIKLPFLTNGEFSQWIWIENHRTITNNGSIFDKLQYQDKTCVDEATPGLYMYLQIDKNDKTGTNTFGGYTNYLQPLPASGFHDFFFETTTQHNDCVALGDCYPFYKLNYYENPLTGNHDQQIVPADTNTIPDDKIYNQEGYDLIIEKTGSGYLKRLSGYGTNEMAFTLTGKNKIDMGTNPSTAALMNLVHINPPAPNLTKNNRKILLNGVSIEILNEDVSGNILIQIRFDDVDVNNDIRWCADEIILNPITSTSGYSLNLKSGNHLTFDQGLSATRIDNPIIFNGQKIFTSPTVFKCAPSSYFHMEEASNVIVNNNSSLVLQTGSTYEIEDGAELTVKNGGTLIIEPGANLTIHGAGKIIVEGTGYVCIDNTANINLVDNNSQIVIQSGAGIGINPDLSITSTANCSELCDLTVTGNGSVYFQPGNISITQDEIWNGNKTVNGVITIKTGKKLTVNDEIQFKSSTSGITVEQGAQLILNTSSSKLTTGCNNYNNLWHGIDVYGDAGASQLTAGAQGQVILKNATIENASTGIKVYSGGIVKSASTTFINCGTAIEFYDYQNFNPYSNALIKNLSDFKNCTFKTDNNMYSNGWAPSRFIFLKSVQGIVFSGNTFINEAASSFSYLDRGNGIESIDASYNLIPLCLSQTIPCTSFKENSFTGLYYAIKAQNTNPLIPVTIRGNSFTDNFHSIEILGMSNAIIKYNEIDVGSNIGSSTSDHLFDAYGIYFEGCTGYTIENNDFTTDNGGRYGLIINNSGAKANLVFDNTYSNFRIACQAENCNGQHGGSFPGLAFKCNEFTNNWLTDIFLSSGIISFHQGYCSTDTKTPAGNHFYSSGIYGNIFANPGVIPFYYHYHKDPSGTFYTVPDISHTLTSIYGIECNADYDPAVSCYIPPINNNSTLKSTITSTNTQLISMNVLFDGGNTQTLLNKVFSNMNSGQLKNALLAASPYLTDTVLIATFKRSIPLTPGHLKEVVIPNSPLTANAYAVFNTLTLPPGIKKQIVDAQTGTSQRSILEEQITITQTTHDATVSELIKNYMSDSVYVGLDSVLAFFPTQPNIASKVISAEAYLLMGNCTMANTMLNQITASENEDIYAVQYLAIYKDLCSAGKTIYQMTASQKQTMQNIAATKTRISANAKVVLSLIDTLYKFVETIEDIDESLIPDSLKLYGKLKTSLQCGNIPVVGDSVIIIDTNYSRVLTVLPAVTNDSGAFKFDVMQTLELDSAALYSFASASGNVYQDTVFKTISQWLKTKPIQLEISGCPSIFGTLYEHADCGGSPVTGDTLFVIDNIENIYDTVFAVTGSDGQFNFSSSIINNLDTNNLYSFKLKSGFGIAYPQFKTISEWKNASPLTLIVDHKQYWTKDFNMADSIYCISNFIDINRNIYVAGTAWYPDYKTDYLLIKYDPLGNELWHLSYNPTGFGNYSLSDMKTDNSGNCILTGFGDDGTVTVKINPDGAIVWSNTWIDDNYYGENGLLALDTLDNIYLASNVTDYNFGQKYIALTKYGNSGQKLWTTFYNNTDSIYVQSVKTDNTGNIAILLDKTLLNSFILKYSSAGSLLWSVTNINNLLDLATDANNSIYATGTINNTTSFITIKYDVSGNEQWQQYYSYPLIGGVNIAYKIAVDKSGNIIVAGTSADVSTTWPLNPSILIPHNRYSLVKYSSDGTELWNTSFTTGSSFGAVHYLASMITDKADNIYTAGMEFFSTILAGRLSKSHGQFLTTKFNPNGENLWYESVYTTSNNSSGLKDIISSENENLYVTGNTVLNGIRTIKYVQCPATASDLKITGNQNTSTNTNIESEYFLIYPNPNDGTMTIDYSVPAEEQVVFELYDQLGKKVMLLNLAGGNNIITISGNELNRGIYYYRAKVGSRKIATDKVVVIK